MEKISRYQIWLIGGMFVSVVTITFSPSQIIEHAKQHVYLSYIFASVFLMLFLWIFGKIGSRFPKKDLLQALLDRTPLLGKALLIVYMLFALITLARDLRLFTDFIHIYLLQETPIILIGTLFIVPTIIMVRSGIEVIARMAELFIPILTMIALSIPVLMLKDVHFDYFLPLGYIDWKGVGFGWFYASSLMGEILLVPLLFSGNNFRFKDGVYGLLLGTVLVLILVVFILLVLGIYLTPKVVFPSYALVKQINITDFLDRFELIMLSLYLPSAIIKMACLLYFVCRGYSYLFPKVKEKLSATPIGFFGLALSFFLYESVQQVINFQVIWAFAALTAECMLPLLLFILLLPKKKRKKVLSG